MNVLDSITKAPSQVLVKSATNFGQDAAKIIGAYAEECVKNSTDDILHEIRETTEKLCEILKESLSGFGDTLHKTGVEAFTEWGIGIERAFLHLGQKLETGLTNSTNRAAYSLREAVDENMWGLRKTIHNSTTLFADAISQFGLKHAEVYKHVFRHEILGLLLCGFLTSISLCIFSIAAASKLGLTGSIFSFVVDRFVAICFLVFAILNGYVIFVSTTQQGPVNPTIAATSNTKNMNDTKSQFKRRNHPTIKIPRSPLANHSSKANLSVNTENGDQAESNTSEDANVNNSNNPTPSTSGSSLIPYIIVASIGYMGGNLSNQVFTFTSLNFLISFVIMTGVTLIAYRVLAFNLLLKIYGLYKHFHEFGEYLKEKRRYQAELNEAAIYSNSTPFLFTPDIVLEPDSALSKDTTMWSEDDDNSDTSKSKLRHRTSKNNVD